MRRFLSVICLLGALALGSFADAGTVTKPFNLSLGSAYSGLTATISYKIVLVDGTTPVGPITATGVTEGSFGTFTATGSYNVNVANFDTSWVGKIVWYESTNEILYEEPFTAIPEASVATDVAAIKAKTDNLPAQPAAVGSAMTVADKTGFKLASNGLDAISMTAPTGLANNFREAIIATWRWFYKASDKDVVPGRIRTLADDGVTVLTSQPYTSDSRGREVKGSSQ